MIAGQKFPQSNLFQTLLGQFCARQKDQMNWIKMIFEESASFFFHRVLPCKEDHGHHRDSLAQF